MRPYRSVLYMPGSNARALEKAKSLAADALILDLEDAVAPDKKAEARVLVADAIKAGGYGKRFLIVRVNALSTEWGADDVAALRGAGADAVLLPKVDGPENILDLQSRLDAAGLMEVKIWAMMETPRGILNALQIADASDRLEGFVLGTNDLMKDVGARPTPDRAAMLPSLSICLLAARTQGLICVDGVFNNIKDIDGLSAECEQGRDLGFDGKTLIHPAQLETANAAFSPTEDELAEAQAFVTAFDDAISRGEAVAVVNGRIVENLHVETAKKLIAKMDAIREMAE